MQERKITDRFGSIKMRVSLPIYNEWGDISGKKNITENLAFIQGGNSETSKIIINAFTRLYDSFELDKNKTTVTYNYLLDAYLDEIQEEEFIVTTPANTYWKLNLKSTDALGNSFEKIIGYIKGDLTPTKALIFDRLTRKIINLSTNTYTETRLEAIFKPYEGGG